MLVPKIEQRIEQYLALLEREAYREVAPLAFEIFETERTYREPPEGVDWRPVAAGGAWGAAWHCAWFRAVFRAGPVGRHGRPLFLRVLPNADSLAFIDGRPAGAFNLFHKKLRLGPEEADGREHRLHVEAYAGHPYGGCGPFEGPSVVVTIGKTLPAFPNTFDGGALLERLEGIYQLYYDVLCLFGAARTLGEDSAPASLRRARILSGLYEALSAEVSLCARGEALEAQALAARARVAPLLAARNGSTAPVFYLTGHAHIDHAWLWPIAETERKIARTYANMTRLMREYPEFIFIQSQPCQLEIARQKYPAVFEDVLRAFREGRWEPNGGMWVEADCNIPSGESLVRQFLVGRAAVREMFGPGYEADTLWLPDVFGYAAALPQILRGCGIKWFVTSKIGWNDTTRFPYDTFIWRGIDGTGVPTHFVSSQFAGYNGHVSAEELAAVWKNVQHKEAQGACLRSIGEGDGGGGTLRADLEAARRFGDLEGLPRTAWTTVSEALRRLFDDTRELPEWQGELYLELHRGTYTSQARMKRANRLLEQALRRAEFLCAAASLEGMEYPRAELLACWKQTLTNQFHDIIPGSCIGRVYAEAEAQSACMLHTLEGLENAAWGYLRGARGGEGGAAPGAGGISLVNDLSWERVSPVSIPAALLGEGAAEAIAAGAALRDAEGRAWPCQAFSGLDGMERVLFSPRLPPLGWQSFTLTPSAAAQGGTPFTFSGSTLVTPYYEVSFDGEGRIVSLRSRASGREFVASGGAFNALVLAEDVPVFWEAWDIDADWTRRVLPPPPLEAQETAAQGPLCFRLRQKRRLGSESALVQDVVFYADSPRIDFDTRVDWRERRRLLKAQFDSAIAADSVRCEVQYGHLLRGAHPNLPSDRARFEFCAQKWVSLEDAAGGIALLNDCKYGHDARAGRLRISLLRAPQAPDPDADQGPHRFTYSLLPFEGPFAQARVIQSAYELNHPARPLPLAAAGRETASLFSIDAPQVLAECVKAPELQDDDDSPALVLRLYESLGAPCRATLRFRQPLAAAAETDLLERAPRPLPVDGAAVPLAFRAFEIKTVILHCNGKGGK